MIETTNYQTVLKTIGAWSPEWRLALIRDLLQMLQTEWHTQHMHKPTLQKALGLLATNQTAPTDAQVQEWLEEHRTEKYG